MALDLRMDLEDQRPKDGESQEPAMNVDVKRSNVMANRYAPHFSRNSVDHIAMHALCSIFIQ